MFKAALLISIPSVAPFDPTSMTLMTGYLADDTSGKRKKI